MKPETKCAYSALPDVTQCDGITEVAHFRYRVSVSELHTQVLRAALKLRPLHESVWLWRLGLFLGRSFCIQPSRAT